MKTLVDPDKPFAETGLRLLADQFRKVHGHEAGTIDGRDIEELHEMRVGVRRVRALLEIFGPSLAPGTAEQLVPRVKKLGKRLGPVRDLDVLLGLLDGLRQDLGLAEDQPTRAIHDGLQARRREDRQQLVHYLQGKKYRGLKQSLAELLDGDH